MFRREWRQQLLVLTLLPSRLRRRSAASRSPTTRFPPTTASSARRIRAHVRRLRFAQARGGARLRPEAFGTTDIVGHRFLSRARQRRKGRVPVPGPGRHVRHRPARSPPRPLPNGQQRRCRYRSSRRDCCDSSIGSTLSLDGHRRTVVGIVENPRRLSDEFALVSPSSMRPDTVTVLVSATRDSLDSFWRSQTRPLQSAFSGSMQRGSDVSGAGERWRCSPSRPSSCCWPR